uniref:Uncharacterized protein n=1 Tax=Solanum tuberosum TaxID=4113 RepID=M1BGM7_SOLTU
MASSMSLLRSSIPWIAVLVPPYLLFASFSGHGVVSISITTSVLVVSTIAFTFSKQKHKVLKKSSVQEEEPQNGNFGHVEEVLSLQSPRIEKGVAQNGIFKQVEEVLSVHHSKVQELKIQELKMGSLNKLKKFYQSIIQELKKGCLKMATLVKLSKFF